MQSPKYGCNCANVHELQSFIKVLWESLIQNFFSKSDKKSQNHQQNLIYTLKQIKGRGGGALTLLISMTLSTSTTLYTLNSNKIGQELLNIWTQIHLWPSSV